MSEKRIVAFIKAVHQDYFDSFLNKGEICMNTAEWFRNIENNDSNTGDKFECTLQFDGKELSKVLVADVGVSIYDKEKWTEIFKNDVLENFTLSQNANIFSLYAIESCTNNIDFIEHTVSEMFINEFNTHRFVFISNTMEFRNRMNLAITEFGREMKEGKVRYSEDSWRYAHCLNFLKREKYFYQNEYRIIFTDEKAQQKIFQLGNIASFCQEINLSSSNNLLKISIHRK